VRKTRKLLVVHEAVQAAGFGAEIAAAVAEELQVPVRRLGAPRIPVGYSKPLEDEARVGAQAILTALS
jgi:pyruvate dehydrogenase E1 component beta subunit